MHKLTFHASQLSEPTSSTTQARGHKRTYLINHCQQKMASKELGAPHLGITTLKRHRKKNYTGLKTFCASSLFQLMTSPKKYNAMIVPGTNICGLQGFLIVDNSRH
eukprot:1143795-Pelagomonas_calceolata.AAC.3